MERRLHVHNYISPKSQKGKGYLHVWTWPLAGKAAVLLEEGPGFCGLQWLSPIPNCKCAILRFCAHCLSVVG